MKNIYIKEPYKEILGNKVRLHFDLMIDKKEKNIWFEVDEEYGEYLCDDRVDAIVVGLLNYAMLNDYNFKSDSYITEELKYKIEEYLIPTLSNHSKKLKKIIIDIATKPTIDNAGFVGTGCSCGIDSMHAIFNNINRNENLKITHLCLNNVGSFNECYKEAGIEEVREYRRKKSLEFAKEINLPMMITDSNFWDEIYQNHLYSCTYSSVFAILCLQKMWKTYYYGSVGLDFSYFDVENSEKIDCADYDLLSLDCFSTNNLHIYSDGGAKSRIEKTDLVKNERLVQKYLHVCTNDKENCGVCPKCRRTLLTLYALNTDMKKYKTVFDIDYFYNHLDEYFDWICTEHRYNVTIHEQIYYELLKNKEFNKFAKSKPGYSSKYLNPKDKIKKDCEDLTIENQKLYAELTQLRSTYDQIINSRTYKYANKVSRIIKKIKGN